MMPVLYRPAQKQGTNEAVVVVSKQHTSPLKREPSSWWTPEGEKQRVELIASSDSERDEHVVVHDWSWRCGKTKGGD